MLKPLPPVAVLLLLSLASCARQGHQSIGVVQHQSASETDPTGVSVHNPVGSLVVTQGDTLKIKADVRYRGSRPKGDAAPRFEEHLRLVEEGGRLTVTSVHAGAADAGDWQLDVTVELPGAPALELTSDVGSVTVDLPAVAGLKVQVDVGTADVRLGSSDGALDVRVETGTATIQMTGRAPVADVTAEVVTGEVSLTLTEDASGVFDLRAGIGTVTVSQSYGLEVRKQQTSATASGRRGESMIRIRANVDTGIVRLQ